jgi:hypothetical protein
MVSLSYDHAICKPSSSDYCLETLKPAVIMPMRQGQKPLPIFPRYEDFLRPFDVNIKLHDEVEGALLTVSPNCISYLCCRSMAQFIRKQLPVPGDPRPRFKRYRQIGECMLNWSFFVRRKSVVEWDAADRQAYLDFVSDPPASWCSAKYYQRHKFEVGVAYEFQKINDDWRPFKRAGQKPFKTEYHIQLGRSFFEFCRAEGLFAGPNPFEGIWAVNPPQSGDSPGLISLPVWQWVVDQVMSRARKDETWEHVIFVMALCFYTEVPISNVAERAGSTPTLSQFGETDQGELIFSSSPVRKYILREDFRPFLYRYLASRGLSLTTLSTEIGHQHILETLTVTGGRPNRLRLRRGENSTAVCGCLRQVHLHRTAA